MVPHRGEDERALSFGDLTYSGETQYRKTGTVVLVRLLLVVTFMLFIETVLVCRLVSSNGRVPLRGTGETRRYLGGT